MLTKNCSFPSRRFLSFAWPLGLVIAFAAVPPVSIGEDLPGETTLPPAATADVDFAERIAPIFRQHCVVCHGPQEQESGFRLDTGDDLAKGGYSGAVVVPGMSGDSRLVEVVAGLSDDGVVMPPEGPRLTRNEIGLVRGWIDQGANWPEGLTLSIPEGVARSAKKSEHWAFQPIRRPPLPNLKQPAWARNPIDRFILARLEAEGIVPAPEADRATLIRRLALDLIGLPPTAAEADEFVGDTRPDAYERLVDRLLASPHYGEHWARPWLDLCHYADTDGYLTDQARPVAWRYRQWLVDALNRDLPFDQFTIEQLAGDLLPGAASLPAGCAGDQLIATGFLRNTLSNREGGADLEEYRVEQVVDRTMMVGTTWLGLTVGCARCHDHKYDPIRQREFYQLYAFFDGADEINIDAPLPGELEAYLAKKPDYDRKRAELLAPPEKGATDLQDRWEKKLLEAVANPGKDALWDRQWEVLGLIWGGQLGEGQLEGTQIVLIEPAKRSQDQHDRLQDYFLQHGSLIDPARFAELKLGEIQQQLAKLKTELPLLTRAPTMHETPKGRQAYLHVRGDFRARGILVKPGVPAVLPGLAQQAPAKDQAQAKDPSASQPPANRLALAQWLVSLTNPLTRRVTVNRKWQEFFGRGLVTTSGDFGAQGARPSHPELLDWLAVELGERGWSTKTLDRLIVTSATYRQSSRARPELAASDPNNDLLARQAPLRLSAHQVRDGALSVGGLLNTRLGGPCVYPSQPASVAMEGFDNKWPTSEGADRYRRGLYTYLQRLSPFAQQVTFDVPGTSRICTRRERSNTPLQALTLLNDPVFFETAQALALRTLREAPTEKPAAASDPTGSTADRTDLAAARFAQQLDYAFRLCLSRPPVTNERERLTAYFNEQLEILRHEPQVAETLFPQSLEGVDPLEGAAWTCVGSTLLNLHEFITRH